MFEFRKLQLQQLSCSCTWSVHRPVLHVRVTKSCTVWRHQTTPCPAAYAPRTHRAATRVHLRGLPTIPTLPHHGNAAPYCTHAAAPRYAAAPRCSPLHPRCRTTVLPAASRTSRCIISAVSTPSSPASPLLPPPAGAEGSRWGAEGWRGVSRGRAERGSHAVLASCVEEVQEALAVYSRRGQERINAGEDVALYKRYSACAQQVPRRPGEGPGQRESQGAEETEESERVRASSAVGGAGAGAWISRLSSIPSAGVTARGPESIDGSD